MIHKTFLLLFVRDPKRIDSFRRYSLWRPFFRGSFSNSTDFTQWKMFPKRNDTTSKWILFLVSKKEIFDFRSFTRHILIYLYCFEIIILIKKIDWIRRAKGKRMQLMIKNDRWLNQIWDRNRSSWIKKVTRSTGISFQVFSNFVPITRSLIHQVSI